MAYVQLIGAPARSEAHKLTPGRYYELKNLRQSRTGGATIRNDVGDMIFILTAPGVGCGYLSEGSEWKMVARKPRGRSAVVQMLSGDLIPNGDCGESIPAAPAQETISRGQAIAAEMDTMQAEALELFTAMYADAESYRKGGPRGKLDISYGICGNIERYVKRGSVLDYNTADRIKDNLIRSVPSFSGEHHYPVPSGHPHRTAEEQWDYSSNRWDDAYGECRLIQLAELIEAIRTRWDDKLTRKMSPAGMRGLSLGDIVQHKESGELWEFSLDDESTNPGFRRAGTKEDSIWINLSEVRKVNVSDFALSCESVADFLKAMEALDNETAELERQVRALKTQIASKGASLSLLKRQLADKHGVKRVKD